MNSGEKFNQFAQQNGGSVLHQDENLILQKELKEETVFWGSVYESEFVEMPDTAFTSEAAYRTWCWKATGMMPEKRGSNPFDKYIRAKMIEASVRPTLPGSEYGAEVDDAIECLLEIGAKAEKRHIDLDEMGVASWSRGTSFWIETLPGNDHQELIIKIKPFMRRIMLMESHGNTQGKIKRRDVCKRLVHYGRQIAGREASVERLRCAYALPVEVLYHGFEAIKGK